MDILGRIDDGLNPKDPIKKTDHTLFESKIDKSLGMITESLDSFLKIIETPTSNKIEPIIGYLQTAGPEDLEDWINALEIAVVEREVLNQWTLKLAQETQKLNIPVHMKPIISGILEALGISGWEDASQNEFCSLCNERGHNNNNCPHPACPKCGYAGHELKDCTA